MHVYPDASLIGLISDTHGLLRKEAVAALRRIAPVVAFRVNGDADPWADSLPATEVVIAAGVTIYMLHDRKSLDLVPKAAGFHIVLSGHSHQPAQEWRREVLYLNPGSAGPRRFQLPITVARLD